MSAGQEPSKLREVGKQRDEFVAPDAEKLPQETLRDSTCAQAHEVASVHEDRDTSPVFLRGCRPSTQGGGGVLDHGSVF